ncbi:MAG: SDR family oxidoreductase [Gemmatimonadota bacterium]
MHVLVAGAAGALGREVTRELLSRGHRVRALVNRTTLPEDLHDKVGVHRADATHLDELRGVADGIDAVFSCLGASVSPRMSRGRRTFHQVDTPANLNLIAAAREAGAGHFVYVSVAGHEELGHLRYVQAHEAVVAALRGSPLSYAVIRPSGFFSAFSEFLRMAEKGTVTIIGDGSARTNPVHDRDLAAVCADAVEGTRGERAVGGPEVLSRREIAELAFLALGKPGRIRSVSPSALRTIAPLVRPLNPRAGDLIAFVAEVFTQDLVVPACGSRTLAAYFDDVASRSGR